MSKSTHPPTPEQIEFVRWTASLGAVTAEALAHRRGVSVASARARLVAARRASLLARERPLSEHPALFTPRVPVCELARHVASRHVASRRATQII